MTSSLRPFVIDDALPIAQWAYTHGREKQSVTIESMPPWEELSYERKNQMANDVVDIYNALVSHGYVIMKEEM